MVYAGRRAATRRACADRRRRSAPRFVLDDDEVLAARPLGGDDRAPLRQADGHRVGQGRRQRRAVHRPGAARDRPGPPRGRRAADLRADEQGRACWPTALAVGDAIAAGPACALRERRGDRPLRGRRRAGHRDHRPRLGADHEAGGGDRHRPRRPHLPRRDRQPRAGAAGDRRHRRRDRESAATARRSRSPAPRATRASSTTARSRFESRRARPRRPAGDPHQGDAQPRRPRPPPSAGGGCRPTASGWRGWSSSSTTTIKVHPMALLHLDQLEDRGAEREIEQLTARLRRQGEYFVDRLARGIARIAASRYPRPGHRADERLQDQRVRRADRRRQLRAGRGEPDARLARGEPLLRRRLPRRLRARVPRRSSGRGSDRARQRRRDDPVLPHAGGGRPGARGDGRGRPGPRGRAASGLRDGRDPRRTSCSPTSSPSASTGSRSAPTTSPS